MGTEDNRIWVSIDWSKVPQGTADGTVTITGPGEPEMKVNVVALNPTEPTRDSLHGFVETNGCVSIESVHFTNKVDSPNANWESIDDLGRTLSSMSIFPVTAASMTPPQSAHLEYRMYLFHPGNLNVEAILDPTQNFVPGRGLRFAISWDDQPPQVVDALEHNDLHDWEETVKDSVRMVAMKTKVEGIGYHTLKVWMVDPGVVLQKLVVDTGGVKPSYLGPPESYFRK